MIETLKQELEELENRRDELEGCENDDEYNDHLNETAGDVEILGMSYKAARVLEDVDPTAYRCGHTDFNDSLLTDVNNEIDDKKAEIEEAEAEENEPLKCTAEGCEELQTGDGEFCDEHYN